MSADAASTITAVLSSKQQELLESWLRLQLSAGGLRPDLISQAEIREQSREFLQLLQAAAQGGVESTRGAAWVPVRELLAQLSRSRALRGFTPVETAMFVYSFKEPLNDALRDAVNGDSTALLNAVWVANRLLDELGLYTMEVYQASREDVIRRQQHELLELSTPVVKLWEGVLALPLIGTLDSARTQIVMESLLGRIVETGASLAIIDITGVPTVDTLVAQHLIKTLAAARLMGADCIISGIRPQIAQTMVQLGVELEDVVTKASLADAFALALRKLGYSLVQQAPAAPARP